MKTQHYGNHKHYYIPHHFIFYPIILLLSGIGIYCAIAYPEQRLLWIFASVSLILVGWFSFIVRQHYALGVQDRIILLELRYRYFALTQQRFENLEQQLSKGQLFALRFAADEEFPTLAERAIKEQLTPDAIKKAISSWQADWMRV